MKKFIVILILILSSAFVVSANEVIQMKKEPSGIYTVPCEVNGLKLRFVFDTGASAVSISLTEASFMLKNGYLETSDIIGTANTQTADGNIAENYTINLKELKIGSVKLTNVKAYVSNGLDAPLLLGQTVLDKLGQWSIKNSQLILNDYATSTSDEDYTFEQLENMIAKGDKTLAVNYLRNFVTSDDYAAYLFIQNVSSTVNQSLIDDQDVVSAMQTLSNMNDKDANDIYLDYDKLIWFCLYRLGNSQKAIDYFKQCEDSYTLTTEQCDKLAESIILGCGWGLDGKVDELFAEMCLLRKYYIAYTLYATYLDEVKNQPHKAVPIYKRLSDLGYLPATTKLGICYIEGNGTTKNTTEGLNLLNKAAEGGMIDAITQLCYRYYYGRGLTKNYDKVLQYSNLYGHNGICDLLNKAYKAVVYFQKEDYTYAFDYLVQLAPVVLFEDRSTISAYIRGINFISCEILYMLGQSYENGLGTSVNFDKAFEYYSGMLDRNPAWGYELLGDLFFLNELLQPDPETAYKYYVLGANNKNSYCAYRLALMNYWGVGTTKNTYKAQEYKRQAIENGYEESDFNF